MLQFTTPQPTLHLATTPKRRSPQVLHRQGQTLSNHVCCPGLLPRGNQILLCSKLPPNRGSWLLNHRAPAFYTTTYAAQNYCIGVSKYYTLKALEDYTTNYAAPTYYTGVPKHNPTSSYYATKASEPQPTLPQLTTKRFLLLELKFLFHFCVFLIWWLYLYGYESLGIDCLSLMRINIYNASNYLVRLLNNTFLPCQHCDRCFYLCWNSSRPVCCVLICLFHVTTALVSLRTDMFWCFDDCF
jgi:hypothetical protein